MVGFFSESVLLEINKFVVTPAAAPCACDKDEDSDQYRHAVNEADILVASVHLVCGGKGILSKGKGHPDQCINVVSDSSKHCFSVGCQTMW